MFFPTGYLDGPSKESYTERVDCGNDLGKTWSLFT